MRNVLVVDDEAGIRTALAGILGDEGYRPLLAGDGPEGLAVIDEEKVDLVLLDVWLPRMGGMDVLAEIKEKRPALPVVVISGHGNIDMAVRALKLGAFDFLEKPLSLDRVVAVCRNALEVGTLREENRRLRSELGAAEMVGSGPAMEAVRKLVEQSAASDARVLITGENGTGKELVARAIHRKSARSGGPFVEVNCAAIPDALLESELFGHERGAFTDAHARRRGKLELADGGTLFLDEVADMSPGAQAKVLRALQELRFQRVGGEEEISVDVRVVAATNKDIPEEIRAGRFREDLYFRLAVVPIALPPLRERGGDLEELAVRFLAESAAAAGRPAPRLAPGGAAALRAHPWPGNVRELRNMMERICVMSDAEELSAEEVASFLGGAPGPADRAAEGLVDGEFAELKLNEARDLFERNFLVQKLHENGYNVSRTAEAIGVYPSNLHAKIKKYGIVLERQ